MTDLEYWKVEAEKITKEKKKGDIKKMKEITKFRLELVKESNSRYDLETKQILNPATGAYIANTIFQFDRQAEEIVGMFALDVKNRIIGAFEVSRGTLDCSLMSTREIFKRAILANSASIMLFHNHPSGDPTPSVEDIETTKRLVECGKVLGITLLDHIIICSSEVFYSLRDKGKM